MYAIQLEISYKNSSEKDMCQWFEESSKIFNSNKFEKILCQLETDEGMLFSIAKENSDISDIYKVIDSLKKSKWLKKHVVEMMVINIDEISDFTEIIKS